MKEKIKKFLKSLSKKNKTFRSIYNRCVTEKRKMSYKKMCQDIPVNDKLVIFESFFAKKYACSPRAIYEYMLQAPEYADYQFIWAFRKPKPHAWMKKSGRTRLVKPYTKQYYKYFAEAKYWVTNTRLPEEIQRKEDQVYLQCWHGTPLKRLGFDIEGKGANALGSTNKVKKQYKNDAKRYSYMVSPSAFCTEKFTSAFNLKELFGDKNIIIEEGYPRNDFLCTCTAEDVLAIKEKLGIPTDKKVLIYAPTWRDNQHVMGVGYTLALKMDLDKMKQQFGEDCVILMRLHYLLADNLDLSEYEGFAYDVSGLDDVNELYVISDVLITDYSSVFFDFAHLCRPIIFYMYDLEEYKNDIRDFYIDLEELPGPIVETEEGLIEELNNLDTYQERYKEKYEAFNNKFNYLDDGQASKRVVEKVFAQSELAE